MTSSRREGPRPAVVGTCTLPQDGETSPDDQLEKNLAIIDRMVAQAEAEGLRLDLAVLPEVSFQFARPTVEAVAEALDGRIVRAVAGRAKRHGIYATAPVHTRREGKVYNSVVLVDREGERVGVYDKVFPVMMSDGSLEYGITPGRQFPVFDLDIGRVGIQICWDIAFDAGWQALANQDAELVLFCTNPASPLFMRGRAVRHAYYIVAATVHPPAVMVDPIGRVLGTTSEMGEVLIRRLNLDYRVLHSNCLWEWPESRRKEYEGRIKLEWDAEAHEYLVTSCDPELPVRRFLEREGLLTGHQRIRRNIALQSEARDGPPVVPDPVERE